MLKYFNSDLLREYCNWETFSAKCNADQVIVMNSATYGRMKVGRCVQHSFDIEGNPHKMGCAEDIIRYLLFRYTQRVLQLGNVQCPLRAKRGCADDICEVWKNEIWKMRPNII